MSNPRPCQNHTLAQNRVARIEHCADCGCVTIHLGPCSFRMDSSTFEGFVLAVVEAGGVWSAGHAAPAERGPRGLA